MNCAIIGAGELGSRHLQGLLRFSKEQIIVYVIDPSDNSLSIANNRQQEIEHNHKIIFSKNLSELPKELFLVIVATSSKIRKDIVTQLLIESSVKYLVLEKVLFPELSQYDEVKEIIEKTNTQTYINHPRRMFPSYELIKKNLLSEKLCNFQLFGINWGLACNALHFIDIFSYLTDSKLLEISTIALDKQILESKRAGYIEFTGTLFGTFNNGSTFSVSSINNEIVLPPSISIMNTNEIIDIEETGLKRIKKRSRTSKEYEEFDFNIHYQSGLTNIILEELIETGGCKLPDYDSAAAAHKVFINALLSFYNTLINNNNNKILPIT